jgi:hypothetical protein
MRDEDFVARLPIAASVAAGTSVSKYFRDCDVEDVMRNSFGNVVGEKDVDDDPAFAVFLDEFEVISKDELIARRREMMATTGTGRPSSEETRANEPHESPSSDEAGEAEESSGNTADGLPTPCQSLESEEERQAREQEERLAALGVTGCAKPVRTPVQRAMVPSTAASSDNKQTAIASGFTAQKGTRCVSSLSPNETMTKLSGSHTSTIQRSNPFNETNFEGFRGSGSPPPNQHAFSLQTPPTSACHDSCWDYNEHPTRGLSCNGVQSTQTNSPGNVKYTHSDAPGVGQLQDYLPSDRKRSNPPPPSNSSGTGMKGEKHATPPSIYSDQERYRQQSAREFSAEVDEGPKRQKDECHQKEGRKAPKVAAAYR